MVVILFLVDLSPMHKSCERSISQKWPQPANLCNCRLNKQQFVMTCRYVSDLSAHANARARLQIFFIIATRPTAAEEFALPPSWGSYIIQKHCCQRNFAFLQCLSSYITQALKVSADSGAYVSKFGASTVFNRYF